MGNRMGSSPSTAPDECRNLAAEAARFFALGSFVHAEKKALRYRCAGQRTPQPVDRQVFFGTMEYVIKGAMRRGIS